MSISSSTIDSLSIELSLTTAPFDPIDKGEESIISKLAETFFEWKAIYFPPAALNTVAVWVKNSRDQCVRKIGSLFHGDSSPLNGKHLYHLLLAEAEQADTQKQSIFREFLRPHLFASYPSSLTSNPDSYDLSLEGPFSYEEEFSFEGRKLRFYTFAKDGDGFIGLHIVVLDSTLQVIHFSDLILSPKTTCPLTYTTLEGKEWAYPYAHHVQYFEFELTKNHPEIINILNYIVEFKTLELIGVINDLGERISENRLEDLKQVLDILLDLTHCYEIALSFDFLTLFRRTQLCKHNSLFQERLLYFMQTTYRLLGQDPSVLEKLNEHELIEATHHLLEHPFAAS